MAPNSFDSNTKSLLNSKSDTVLNKSLSAEYKIKIVWPKVLALIALHLAAINSLYLGIFGISKWQTFVWCWLVGYFSSFGILSGSHRLWSHKSYKAKLPLRIILVVLHTAAFQKSIYEWCRDHRIHHKYSETNSDPHNAKRGFFFAHMGWLLCNKHPEVIEKEKTVDLSDLLADPLVRFQNRFYIPLVILFWGIIPVGVPMYFFGEPLMVAFCGKLSF